MKLTIHTRIPPFRESRIADGITRKNNIANPGFRVVWNVQLMES
nr:MAG TPA: hypothetical protein [Caudoviricetes sp.]